MPMGLSDTARKYVYPPAHQVDAVIAQAAPVQNQWYPVLAATANVILYNVSFSVATTDETLELRITIDGQVLTQANGSTAGTIYYVTLAKDTVTTGGLTIISGLAAMYFSAFIVQGRSITVEIRKTTAAGAGTLSAKAIYGVY